jgi:hydroxymethylglutaryl-CoA lyase
MATLPERIKIVEVGPRDGLQNEAKPVPTDRKIAFIEALADAGLKQIEATSFVHPKTVPQLADAVEVAKALPRGDGVVYSALVPNEKGLDRAVESGIRRIALFTAASDTFARRNLRMSIDESVNAFRPVARRALQAGITVRGYVSTAFVCPYEGEIAKERVRDVTERLVELGCDEVAVSDTIGAAAPGDVLATVGFVAERVPRKKIALHFHDTYGTALANVCAGLQLGIETYDSSVGGLGGCPFAPGSTGNLATEDLVYMLERMGIRTGVKLEKVVKAAQDIAQCIGHELHSKQARRLGKANGKQP